MIRADGEMLYGGVGALPGEKLPQMLMNTLRQSGRAFEEGESELLNASVSSAQSALDDGDLLKAAVALSSINKLGSPDELGSYAEPALRAAELYKQIQSMIDQQVQKSKSKLNEKDSDDSLDSIIAMCEGEAAYKLFHKSRRQATVVTRPLRSSKTYEHLLAQADALVRARTLRSTVDRRIQSRAIRAYIDVIRRFPGTEVETIARSELMEFAPDAEIPNPKTQPPPPTTTSKQVFRTWTARSGKFTTTAKYVQRISGKVQLAKQDGSQILVDISLLSDEDQRFLRTQK